MFFLVGCWVPTSPIRPSGHELHVILTVVPCAVIPCNFHGIAVALRGAFLEVGDKLLVKPEFRCKLQKLRDSSGLEFVLFGPSLFAHCLKHTYCYQVLGESLRTLLSQDSHTISQLARYEIMDGFCNPNGYSSTLCSLHSNITPMEVEGVFGTEMLFLMSPCLGVFGVYHLGFS